MRSWRAPRRGVAGACCCYIDTHTASQLKTREILWRSIDGHAHACIPGQKQDIRMDIRASELWAPGSPCGSRGYSQLSRTVGPSDGNKVATRTVSPSSSPVLRRSWSCGSKRKSRPLETPTRSRIEESRISRPYHTRHPCGVPWAMASFRL